MNFLDIIILIIIGIFCVKGLMKGLIREVFTLIGLLVGYVVAMREMSVSAHWLKKVVDIPASIAGVVTFILLFIGVLLLFRWLAGLLKILTRHTLLAWVDRSGGFLLGLFKGLLVSSLVMMLFYLIPVTDFMEKKQDDSVLFRPVRSVAPAVFNIVKRSFPKTKGWVDEAKEVVSRSLDETVRLPGEGDLDEQVLERLQALKEGH
jgi:membrane protein required for colicin V production